MPDLLLETSFDHCVIGIDEAGRGPWAGPVMITALWLNPDAYDHLPNNINDSKKIKPHRRAILANSLQMPPHLNCTISKDVGDIDRHGIVKTILTGMEEAAAGVIAQMAKVGISGPTHALVDGPLLPNEMPCASTAVIHGDSRSLSIAGASIIAKHSRDLIMQTLDTDWPVYGWRQNNGYGTRQHQQALEKYGISPHHRRSFAPIKRLVQTTDSVPGHI